MEGAANRRSERTDGSIALSQVRRFPIPETIAASASPGRNATAKVPSVQRAPGNPRTVASIARHTASTTGKAKAVPATGRPFLTVWLARIQAPIHGMNVPTIHHTGWYHQLLPPPIWYHRSV